MISDSLDNAYRRTRYRAELPTGTVDLLIDQPCPALDVWLESQQLGSAAFITACNPQSRALPDADNMQRLRALETELRRENLKVLPGAGIPGDTGWAAEPSLLIAGIDQTRALELARTHGQIALVWHSRGRPSRLLFTGLGEVDGGR